MRAYKTVNDSYIEPVSFTVPRRAEVFQSDIFPPATGSKAAVSAADWLAGKDGIPAKIDLESVYEGKAPVEVASDYKPPVAAPAPTPVKAAPVPKKEEQAPTPVQRAPPPSMSEQKGSISAMASKFQDDGADDDDNETSSFEEIAKPIQKHIPAAARVDSKPVSPTKSEPPKPSPVAQAAPRSFQPPATIKSPTVPTSSGPISPVGSSSSGSVETSLAQIKELLEAQTRTLNAQSEKIVGLTQEVDTLKMRVGSGTQDQTERIRQLELELETLRS